uniref:Myb/SANT-like DNA-binding domain-containing protein n=1 Tax=Chelydra serpentina TaxID=8475 RepID=A0A8C3RZ23_CHESE
SCLPKGQGYCFNVTMQSQNRKRAPAWTDREVLDLIAVWGDESVLSELRSKRRNAKIYEKISKAMTERGYGRDATQCRVKIKELRQAYQKTKESNGRSGSQPQTCRFYETLHAILGGAATTTPPVPVDSNDGVLSTATSSEVFADREGDEEDEAVDSAFNSDFPDSQDLFITLTEIPYEPSQGGNPDCESGEGSVGEPFMLSSGSPAACRDRSRVQPCHGCDRGRVHACRIAGSRKWPTIGAVFGTRKEGAAVN